MARGSSSTDDALVSLEWTTGAALAPYEACRQILAEALDVEPGLETVTLYESIRSGDLSRGAKAISPRHNLPGYDLLEMPDPGQFFGREDELSQLNQWLVADRCRLGPILDVGGVGKTSLAATFASSLLDQADSLTGSERPFSKIIWRSLLNAPPLSDILRQSILFLSDQQIIDIRASLDEQLRLLTKLLQQQRCLLILNNAESIMQTSQHVRSYRTGYEGYGQLIQRVAQSDHQSYLLLTGRSGQKASPAWRGTCPRFVPCNCRVYLMQQPKCFWRSKGLTRMKPKPRP